MSAFNFQEAVIDLSYQKPVVVDFWAPWCGPCRFLGHVLDDLANQASDKWALVKINTDEHEELSGAYEVRGIPAVKMFYRGKVKAEFVGALPKPQVERWLQANLPDEKAELLEKLQELLLQPHSKADALIHLQAMVQQYPNFYPALLALAEQIVWEKPIETLELLKPIGEFDHGGEKAADLRNFAQFILFMPDEATQNTPAGQALIHAQTAAKMADFETAITQLINSVAADKNFNHGLARKTAISLFRYWGFEHPLSRKYRHKFDMLLY
ncbi:MAG TPA: tetratricopeptide repeat protein [Chitinophagales bacterium]|nr:tetratricopeptide repeat protein [Chitinophagales bacterium]